VLGVTQIGWFADGPVKDLPKEEKDKLDNEIDEMYKGIDGGGGMEAL